jgi:hypothetical protein
MGKIVDASYGLFSSGENGELAEIPRIDRLLIS